MINRLRDLLTRNKTYFYVFSFYPGLLPSQTSFHSAGANAEFSLSKIIDIGHVESEGELLRL